MFPSKKRKKTGKTTTEKFYSGEEVADMIMKGLIEDPEDSRLEEDSEDSILSTSSEEEE